VADFKSFPKGLLPFLGDLSANNNRDWFADNKHRYEDLVLNPALDFIGAMGPHLEKISTRFEAIPKRSGGSLMRVYRDTRFGKDKTPYKTNVHEVFVGVGSWRPDSTSLAKIRTRIAEKPDLWKRVEGNRKFRKHYEFGGDRLKKPPRGYDRDHPLIEVLKRKDFIALKYLDERDIESDDFIDTIFERFRDGLPLMRFLCEALELQF
jgi:uncharacterized protein (DUF2461 family)